METKLFSESQIKDASQIIKDGGTVAFRTETVYGLGADATNETAVKKIYEAKGRPSDNPLIVHFSCLKMLGEYFDLDTFQTKLLGIPSLTVLLPYKDFKKPLAKVVTGGNANVAVRIPCCAFTKKFITACEVPLAAPSANTSTRPSPTTWQDVSEDLDGKIDAIIKGCSCKRGVESTVVSVDNSADGIATLYILRQGAVTQGKLQVLTGLNIIVSSEEDKTKQSPGVRFKHYAPAVPMFLAPNTAGIPDMVIRIHKAAKEKPVVVMCISKHKKFFDEPKVLLGSSPKKIYKRFYSSIRKAEKMALQAGEGAVIIIEDMPKLKEFQTLHDRMKKATQGKEI